MAADSTLDRADWQPSPQPEDSVISPEHLALVDFAQRLGSVTTNDEPGIADAGDVRQHADLLMSLLSSPPHVVRDDGEHNSMSSVPGGPPNDHHYMSDASTSSATTSSTQHRRESFRFSHPSLSLDRKRKPLPPKRTPCTAPEKDDETEDSEMPPPAVLLGRALKVDDREAHRLSADAMARNLLQSFQKAIIWRIQAWMDTLSASLVQQEKALLRQNATEAELRELLKTSEAQLILKLRQVSKAIEVKRVETCFHVLPQRIERQQDEEESDAPLKRRRIESEDSELRMGETEYQYTVCHALEFDGTLHLKTPAGHSEITLEVPGFIEGHFLSSEPGMEDLTAVEVGIDTNILASMVEKSCRIIVRSSVEHICKRETPQVSAEEPSKEAPSDAAEASSPYPRNPASTVIGESPSDVAIVTPRAKAPPVLEGGEPISLQIPDDLDSREPRRISPQPHMTGMHFTPSTPSTGEAKQMPCMVSPAPKGEILEETGFRLTKRGKKTGENGPNLPVLVEVACAARQAKAGLTAGQ